MAHHTDPADPAERPRRARRRDELAFTVDFGEPGAWVVVHVRGALDFTTAPILGAMAELHAERPAPGVEPDRADPPRTSPGRARRGGGSTSTDSPSTGGHGRPSARKATTASAGGPAGEERDQAVRSQWPWTAVRQGSPDGKAPT
ncbi:hypothetical protein [Streptosporangium carneum]|uniref:hypothetical protein n=1 Tax=Streptosporangium carneum TaxID=47481 RepID=UPI0031F108AF